MSGMSGTTGATSGTPGGASGGTDGTSGTPGGTRGTSGAPGGASGGTSGTPGGRGPAAAQRRLARELAASGRPHPMVAAVALMCRGLAGLEAETFARRLGIAPRHLAAIEAGIAPGWAVPHRLTALAPHLDWPGAGVEASTGADRARRHPAAHRPGRAGGGDEPP